MLSKFNSCFKLLPLQPNQLLTHKSTPLTSHTFSSSKKPKSSADGKQKKQMIGDVEVCEVCDMHTLDYDHEEDEKYKAAESNQKEILRGDHFSIPNSPYSSKVQDCVELRLYLPKPTHPPNYLRMMLMALGKPLSEVSAKKIARKLASEKEERKN